MWSGIEMGLGATRTRTRTSMAKSQTIWPGVDTLASNAKTKEVGADENWWAMQTGSASCTATCFHDVSTPSAHGSGSVSRSGLWAGARGPLAGQHWRLYRAWWCTSDLLLLCAARQSAEDNACGGDSSCHPQPVSIHDCRKDKVELI